MSLTEVRRAIAAAIEATGVKSTPYVTDQVNTPQAVVVRGEINYNHTFDPTHAYTYTIRVYATRTNPAYAQEFLDDLADPDHAKSIKTAVETDEALAALIQHVSVTTASITQTATVGETEYLFVDFTTEVVV